MTSFEKRYTIRTHQLRKFIEQCRDLNNKAFTSLADIGCADGILSYQTADLFNIPNYNTYGVDIRNILSTEKEINYIQCDLEQDKINLPDNFINLVTCTQVLHHIKNWKNVLQNIADILLPNGYLIIRETYLESQLNTLMMDIQHGLYACVINKEMSINDYINYFDTNYLTEMELKTEIKKHFVIKNEFFDG